MVYFVCDGRIFDLRYFFLLISFTADEMEDLCVLSTYFFIVRGGGGGTCVLSSWEGEGGPLYMLPPPPVMYKWYMYIEPV